MYLFSFSKSRGFHLDGVKEMKRKLLGDLERLFASDDEELVVSMMQPENVKDHVTGIKGKVATYEKLVIRKKSVPASIYREEKTVYLDIAPQDLPKLIDAVKKNIQGEIDFNVFGLWFWNAW